ncbi:MAG: ThiF family adenylyltransferase [Candidatus Helarchaeota archaeon]
MKHEINKVLFQNADTSESLEIELKDTKYRIRDIAHILIKKNKLKSPPFFFTIFKENPTETQYLEEDDELIEIVKKKLDQSVPIWWQTSDLDLNILYNFRVDRFIKAGYKLDIIREKSIMVVGLGLLGSEIALHCATIGFKTMTILDYGSVDWYNIYRQPLYNKDDVFKKKTDVGKIKLESMGGIEVKELSLEIPNFNSIVTDKKKIIANINLIETAIKENDIIITALDTFSARMVIQILALIHNKILINTAAGLIGGIIQIVRPFQDPCIGCGTFYDKGQETGACTLASFGTPKIIAGLCIDIILDIIEERYLNFNYLKYYPNYKIESKTFYSAENCPFCGKEGVVKQFDGKNKLKLLDWLFNEL